MLATGRRSVFSWHLVLRLTCKNRALLPVLRRRGAQQSAGGLNVLAPRSADGGLYSLRRQRVAEADHRLVVGREEGRSGDFVEPDQVYAALDAVQQAAQLADMPRRVVQAAHHDIFERHAPLVGEVVPAQDGRDFGDRPCPFDRHDCGPLLVKRVVQTYGQMHFRRVEKPLQFGRYARRGEGDARRRPAEAPLRSHDFERPQYVVRVVERLAHAHEDDVRQTVAFGQRDDLVEDFGRRQRVLQPLPSRRAEFASHAASGLRRDAQRGPLAVGNVGRFDPCALLRAVEVLFRSVGRFGDPRGRGECGQ